MSNLGHGGWTGCGHALDDEVRAFEETGVLISKHHRSGRVGQWILFLVNAFVTVGQIIFRVELSRSGLDGLFFNDEAIRVGEQC